ncbi:LysR family transcriptional regulator [Vibrio sp. Isolate31]|uniref:LysR family transcriptional regulator n=1 Tax=unclassified Vibrio TaxID=2614977 RepID=UPI001EFC5491|nr:MULTISPECIES: LysR family transcriptional regulator [unclassified Vibrio]MCG9554681.1 LysR family transcriptional regulator [Vibrio sp. Isolate32]MCG9600069.1 LysR family transcriptional regulator [Vibrio sp. Isolate31]
MDTNRLLPLLSEMGIFVNVVELGSFSKTAVKLGVSPSSISRSVTRLENALEIKLLNRSTRQVKLSTDGEEVFRMCCEMLNNAKEAVSAAKARSSEYTGRLKVAAPKALSKQVLTPIILAFMKKYPNIQLQLTIAEEYIDPINEEIDLVIHITSLPVEGLVATTLGSRNNVLCASPDYIERHGTPKSPTDIHNHNCICLTEKLSDRVWHFSNGVCSESIQVDGNFSVNHSEIRREAVLEGMGISMFPDFSVQEYIKSGAIVPILGEWRVGASKQQFVVAQYIQSKFVPKQLKVFVNFLKERMISCSDF